MFIFLNVRNANCNYLNLEPMRNSAILFTRFLKLDVVFTIRVVQCV